MTPERHRHVGELYHAALAVAPEERTAFLATATGDDAELQREVESLLTAHAHAGSFIVAPAAGAFTRGGLEDGAPFVGRQIGAYTIQGALGAGGMGEVYRARDGTLGRDVAIKILPRVFSTDPDRRARFDREARLLASLNHPHIGAIYGVEESDGVRALVLELVEGDTLADRLARGPIPISEALPIARQIADALEAAHENGIVHRDLKPANIKITPDGIVKVLDFGLAKAASGDAPGPDLTHAPTLTSDGTRDGVILGTAAYMSPEQARGKPVDKRADIWAFGCVLYEMLTARAVVTGETLSDMLAAILEREPDWQALPSATPGKIQDLLRRCLQKDSHRRLRDIGDARLEIDDALAAPTPASVVVRTSSRPTTAVLVTAIAAAVITSIGWLAFSVSPPAPAVKKFSIILPPGQRFQNTSSRLVAISPDGDKVVYVANGGVYRRPISELEATVIPGTESLQASYPVFSPDSQSVALYSASDRTVKRIPLGGGPAVTIGEEIDLPYGMSWGEGGILVGQTGKGIIRVLPEPGGGTPDPLVTIKPGEIADGPQMLPGGKSVLFALLTTLGSENFDSAQIVVQSISSHRRTPLHILGSDARYLPSGHIVYAFGGSLYAVQFDLEGLQVKGEAALVVKGVGRTPRSGSAQFSYSDTGTLVYLPGPAFSTSSERDLVLIDPMRDVMPLKVARRAYESPRFSPDGTRIAVTIDNGKEANIWIYDLAGTGPMRQLTSRGRNRFPVWLADGEWVAFQSDRHHDLGIFRQRAAAFGGEAERLTTPDPGTSHIPESWSRTNQVFSFSVTDADGASLRTYSLVDRKATPFGDVRADFSLNSVFSPDGRWLAYTMRRSSPTSVYVQSFPYTDPGHQISNDDEYGHHPLWLPDSGGILYFKGANALVARSVTTTPVTFGDPATVRGEFIANVSPTSPRNHDIRGDGTIVMVLDASEPTKAPNSTLRFDVVLNWTEEVKQRVPKR